MFFGNHSKIHQLGNFFLGRMLFLCGGWARTLIIESSHCFVLVLKILTAVGVGLILKLFFFVTVNVAILSFTRFVLVTFKDLLTSQSHLFVSFSVREYTVECVVFFSSTESVFESFFLRLLASLYFHLHNMNMSLLNLNDFFRTFLNISDGPSPNHRWPGMGGCHGIAVAIDGGPLESHDHR